MVLLFSDVHHIVNSRFSTESNFDKGKEYNNAMLLFSFCWPKLHTVTQNNNAIVDSSTTASHPFLGISHWPVAINSTYRVVVILLNGEIAQVEARYMFVYLSVTGRNFIIKKRKLKTFSEHIYNSSQNCISIPRFLRTNAMII